MASYSGRYRSESTASATFTHRSYLSVPVTPKSSARWFRAFSLRILSLWRPVFFSCRAVFSTTWM